MTELICLKHSCFYFIMISLNLFFFIECMIFIFSSIKSLCFVLKLLGKTLHWIPLLPNEKLSPNMDRNPELNNVLYNYILQQKSVFLSIFSFFVLPFALNKKNKWKILRCALGAGSAKYLAIFCFVSYLVIYYTEVALTHSIANSQLNINA